MNKIITPSASNNIILWLLSYICLPISKLFNYFKFTPNFLTFLSFIFAVLGCREILNENLSNFCFLLLISVILDVCDGQVARLSKNINNSKIDIDHLSDIIKICLIYLSFGILLNNKISWIYIFFANFFYLFHCILHTKLNEINKQNQKKSIKILKPMFFNYFSINIFWMLYKICIPLIFTFNAHSLFLFLLILIDLKFLNLILFYFIILYIYRILKSLKSLAK